MTTKLDEDSSLFMLQDYECPEGCEFFDHEGEPLVTEDEALLMVSGSVWVDENEEVRTDHDPIGRGETRCIMCGAELDQTMESLLGMATLIMERHPEMAATVAAKMTAALTGDVDDG